VSSYPTLRLVGPVEVGPIAHGGHCVTRLATVDTSADSEDTESGAGRVIFVRHAIPGETVMVQLTDTEHARFWRGDAVEVLQPSPDRVPRPCPIAGPGLCGGCDFQHVDLAAQRRLKAAVVAEQLHRLAGVEWSGTVEPVLVDGRDDGLRWRTRMRYQVDDQGRPGLRGHRSRAVVPLPPQGCLIASGRTPSVVERDWAAAAELIAAGSAAQSALLVDGRVEQGTAILTEHAAGRDWAVPADGFWQVHPGAAETLVAAVLSGLQPKKGERAFDLYCGVGLFAGALADAGCRVWGLESGRRAVDTARRNLADVSERVRLSVARVDRGLNTLPTRTDLVVLDPPRTGAGKAVIQAIASRRPRAIAYVACDPAALARDLGTAKALNYDVISLRAFDLFPMTQHVECVAVLQPREATLT
jgi:tRNA/tmRNA/rRNA uracil-C5-methylase (TrmA/RlmC/RlmD family)